MNTQNITENTILNTDSYKLSHFGFEDAGTTKMVSYIEARNGGEYDETIFFGLQYFLKKYMQTRITRSMVDQAEKVVLAHGLPFNREGWDYIVDQLGGRIPLKIKAVKEGSLIPTGNALVVVENTDPNCAWVTSYFETAILRAVWYGTTVATRAFKFRQLIKKYLEITGDVSELDYKFIDFGSRGASSKESSEIAGAAHQISFAGTDNIVGILAAMEYYNCPEVPSHSIAASEHTVTISWGQDREKEFFKNAIKVYGGEGKMFANVCDSYSFENALKIWGEDLKEALLESGGTVVIRPDSGVPVEQVMLAVSTLEKYYGSTINEKGYKLLNPAVRVIQGDGVNLESVEEILKTLEESGYSTNNVTFGCGGYLLQDMTRDTLRFAMKGSYTEVKGERREIRKTVETDPSKASKAGNLMLVRKPSGDISTIRAEDITGGHEPLLETVYFDGIINRDQKFTDIRKIVSKY